MAKKAAAKPKSAKSLKHTGKGKIRHIEIHPAKNSSGGQAFISKIFRNHPNAVEGTDHDKDGRYLPPPDPEMTPHEDGEDMLDHVASTYGIKQAPDGDADEDDQV